MPYLPDMRNSVVMLIATLWVGIGGCASNDGPTRFSPLAKPAGNVTLVGNATPETGAPGGGVGPVDAGTGGGDAAVATDAGFGFCAQIETCGMNEFFSPDVCTCLPAF